MSELFILLFTRTANHFPLLNLRVMFETNFEASERILNRQISLWMAEEVKNRTGCAAYAPNDS